MALNLNLLRSFWMVARAGSVSKASAEGWVSQPALSKAVSELERQVGLPLLERGARGVRLTSAGRSLFGHAQAIFALERAAEEALEAERTMSCATLRVGASTTIATYVLPPLLAQFRAAHAGLTLKIARANTRGIKELLAAFELDVALVEGPAHDGRIEARRWRQDELVVVCAPDHPLAGRAEVDPEELAAWPWLSREEGSGTREVTEQALRPWNLPPREALEIGGAEALKQAAAAGLGLAVVSRHAASDQIALGRLQVLEVRGLSMVRPFWMLRLKNRPASPAARAFEAWLQQDADEQVPLPSVRGR